MREGLGLVCLALRLSETKQVSYYNKHHQSQEERKKSPIVMIILDNPDEYYGRNKTRHASARLPHKYETGADDCEQGAG